MVNVLDKRRGDKRVNCFYLLLKYIDINLINNLLNNLFTDWFPVF